MRESTIFEKIIAGEIPSTKIRENDDFIAILDVFPNCKGQSLVITKQWYSSDLSQMPSDVYARFMLAAKEVSLLLKKGLGVERIGMIVEGEGVDHAHIKLYPMDMTGDKTPYDKQWFDAYPGYLTSKIGEMRSKDELDSIAKALLSKN